MRGSLNPVSSCGSFGIVKYSLMVSNWNGYYTHKSREDVRNAIAEIMGQMSVEVITDKAEFTIDADAGI